MDSTTLNHIAQLQNENHNDKDEEVIAVLATALSATAAGVAGVDGGTLARFLRWQAKKKFSTTFLRMCAKHAFSGEFLAFTRKVGTQNSANVSECELPNGP